MYHPTTSNVSKSNKPYIAKQQIVNCQTIKPETYSGNALSPYLSTYQVFTVKAVLTNKNCEPFSAMNAMIPRFQAIVFQPYT